jgi:hypothetical protein
VVALIAYWDPGHGDNPPRLETVDQLDRALEEVRATRRMAVVELLVADDRGRAILDVGLNGDRGTLYYAGENWSAWFSSAGKRAEQDDDGEPLLYYYMTADTEYPRSAEIPVEQVMAAAREYMTSGGARPAGVEWQSADAFDERLIAARRD